ncbi:MAG: lasso peptide biosynthesis B2 protein [Gammaproteobacteria bacterium]
MPQYALARHVFVCVQGEHVVFLDVRKDRYFALESARTASLGYLVPGWPVPAQLVVDFVRHDASAAAPALSEQVNRNELTGVLSLLLDKGILVPESAEGKAAQATVAQPLRADLTAEDLDERPRLGPYLFLRFVSSAVGARLLLKHRTFETVVGRVRARAEHGRPRNRSPLPQARLQQLVGSFATLRPFFFAAKDSCLFDALSLSEFLAGYGVFPNWVFGVQSRPFAAHCWLQLEGVVLNDTVDHVKRYTPIMVV